MEAAGQRVVSVFRRWLLRPGYVLRVGVEPVPQERALDGVLESALGDVRGYWPCFPAAVIGLLRSSRCDTIFGTIRSKHRHTVANMRSQPTPAGIRWADVVAMLRAAEVDVSERA